MKILNRGKRDIHGETVVPFSVDESGVRTYTKDADGNEIKPIPFVFKPNTAIDFDPATAHKLRRLYKGELVTFEDLERQFDGSTLASANAPVAGRMHQNEVKAAPEVKPLPQTSDLSEQELLVIARMRTAAAQPLEAETMKQAEPVKDPVETADDAAGEQTAEVKKTSFLDNVKSKLHGGA